MNVPPSSSAPPSLESEILKMDNHHLLSNLALFLRHSSKISMIRDHVQQILPKIEKVLQNTQPSVNHHQRTFWTLFQELGSFLFGLFLLSSILGGLIYLHILGSKNNRPLPPVHPPVK
jgi:hypothetical protein